MLLMFTASLPPNMGDSILTSLSMPPSGRAAPDQSTGASRFTAEQFNGSQLRATTQFIKPVIGLISNEDVPVMMSSSKKASSSKDAKSENLNPPNENLKFTSVKQKQNTKENGVKDGEEQPKKKRTLNRSSGTKRKRAEETDGFSDGDDEQEVLAVGRTEAKRTKMYGHSKDDQRINEHEEDGVKTVRNEGCDSRLLTTCMSELGVKALHLPEDPSMCSIFASCLTNQPRVVIEKLSFASASTSRSGREGKSLYVEENLSKRLPMHQQTSSPHCPGLDDKE